jgi:hypothetical protein
MEREERFCAVMEGFRKLGFIPQRPAGAKNRAGGAGLRRGGQKLRRCGAGYEMAIIVPASSIGLSFSESCELIL